MQNQTPALNARSAEAMVICENSRGAEIHGTLVRLARHEVSFEIYSASDIVQMSEVLSDFRILMREQLVYSGRAVITNLVNASSVVLCQANLQDSWLELDVLNLAKEQIGRAH